MPLSSNPNKTTPYWLEVDKDEPMNVRPVFKVRFLTELQFQEQRELMANAASESDLTKAYAMLTQAIRMGVVGWERFTDIDGKAIDWDTTDLIGLFARARMTQRELWELAWNYPLVAQPVKAELPLSASPVSSDGAGSAPNAEKPAAA